MAPLTAPERETIILLDDSSNTATVTTWQRKVLTKLDRNPLATKTAEYSHGTQRGARYEMPAWAVSFRTTRRKASNPTGNAASLRNAAIKTDTLGGD
jgi:hypothetical protein